MVFKCKPPSPFDFRAGHFIFNIHNQRLAYQQIIKLQITEHKQILFCFEMHFEILADQKSYKNKNTIFRNKHYIKIELIECCFCVHKDV